MTPAEPSVLIIGAGPAGMAAAEVLSAQNVRVTLLEAGRRPGIKFLVAGRSGLNLTMNATAAEVLDNCSRDVYGREHPKLRDFLMPCMNSFDPNAIRDWAASLGTPTTVGTSGKVFPVDHHGAGLLRNWERRLYAQGVNIKTGFSMKEIRPNQKGGWDVLGPETLTARHVICALGGGSWPQTGSTGHWQSWLRALNIPIIPMRSANCGIEIPWDEPFISRHEGHAIKNITIRHGDTISQGEVVVTRYGLEGYAIYPLIPHLRYEMEHAGYVDVHLDLCRDLSRDNIVQRLRNARAKSTLTNRLRSTLKLTPSELGLMHFAGIRHVGSDDAQIAEYVKSCRIRATAFRPLEESISTAGGVSMDALTTDFELRDHPGLSLVGEMLDWEAPTGGYLLSACLAMGRHAGLSISKKIGRPT